MLLYTYTHACAHNTYMYFCTCTEFWKENNRLLACAVRTALCTGKDAEESMRRHPLLTSYMIYNTRVTSVIKKTEKENSFSQKQKIYF